MANTTVMNISKGPHSAKVIRQKLAGDSKAYFMAKFYTNGRYQGEDNDYHGWEDVNDTIATAKSILHQLASHSGHGHHELIIDDKRRGSNLRENVLLEYKRFQGKSNYSEYILNEYGGSYGDGRHQQRIDNDAYWVFGRPLMGLGAGAGTYVGGKAAQALGLDPLYGAVPGAAIGLLGGIVGGYAASSLFHGKSPTQIAQIKQSKFPVGSKVTFPDPNIGNYGNKVKGTVVKHTKGEERNNYKFRTHVKRDNNGKIVIVSTDHLEPA